MVLRSITSASIPSLASSSAASKAYLTTKENATIVTSFPSRSTFALPISTIWSSSYSSSKEKPRDYQDKILHAWRNQYIKGIKGESNGRAQDVQSDFRRARKNLNNFARKWGALNDLYYSVREALPLKKAELVRAYENGEISELEKQIKEKEIAKLEDWKLKKEAKLMGSVHSQKDGKPGVYESETYRLLDDRVRKKDDLLKQENDFYQQAARLNDQGKYINSDHFASSHFDHSYYANAPIEEDLLKQKEIKELNDWGQKWDLAGWGKQWDDARIAKENDDLKDTLGAWGKTLGYEG